MIAQLNYNMFECIASTYPPKIKGITGLTVYISE